MVGDGSNEVRLEKARISRANIKFNEHNFNFRSCSRVDQRKQKFVEGNYNSRSTFRTVLSLILKQSINIVIENTADDWTVTLNRDGFESGEASEKKNIQRSPNGDTIGRWFYPRRLIRAIIIISEYMGCSSPVRTHYLCDYVFFLHDCCRFYNWRYSGKWLPLYGLSSIFIRCVSLHLNEHHRFWISSVKIYISPCAFSECFSRFIGLTICHDAIPV